MVVNKSKAAFRTIAEVADELGVATHVLRFWETKFPQIKPMKRSGGRRYYRHWNVNFMHVTIGWWHGGTLYLLPRFPATLLPTVFIPLPILLPSS